MRRISLSGLRVRLLPLVLLTLAPALGVPRPVKAFVGATRRLAAGDLTARTGLASGQGGIGQLAQAFDEMAEVVEQNEAERRWRSTSGRSGAAWGSYGTSPSANMRRHNHELS